MESNCFTNRAGVLDYYQGGIKGLYPRDTPSKKDFTYQMSDHLPLWIQVAVDTLDEKIEQVLGH